MTGTTGTTNGAIDATQPSSAAAAPVSDALDRGGQTRVNSGRAEAFEQALGQAVAGAEPRLGGGVQVGRLVDRLPAGRVAEAWQRWQPPADALGARSPSTGAGPLSSGGVGSMASSGPLNTAGLTGAVFPQARTAGEAVVNAAAQHLGVPYLWGGTDAEHGFDCSGLVQDAYAQIGVDMPKWSRHQATMGVPVDSIDEALPGDVLTFGQPVNHVALYVGDGKMLHAPRTGEVIKIEEIDRPINSIKRIVTPAPTGSTGPVTAASGLTAVPLAGDGLDLAELPYSELFAAAGQRWNVDPGLLAAVARAESNFNPQAVSPVGAQGLMQFMPATAAEMGVDPWDPASAIDGAARYLRNSLDRFGSVELAVASYNAGGGAVSRYGGIPPYRETQNYVRKVLDTWRSRS